MYSNSPLIIPLPCSKQSMIRILPSCKELTWPEPDLQIQASYYKVQRKGKCANILIKLINFPLQSWTDSRPAFALNNELSWQVGNVYKVENVDKVGNVDTVENVDKVENKTSSIQRSSDTKR